jgi:hypothetical protein
MREKNGSKQYADARNKRWAEAAKDPNSHLGRILDVADGLGNYWAKAGGDYSGLHEFLHETGDAEAVEGYLDLNQPEDMGYFHKIMGMYEALDASQKEDFELACFLGWENPGQESPAWKNPKS